MPSWKARCCAPADRHLWSQSYEGQLRDTLALQNKVAQAIADQIRASVNSQEQAELRSTKTVNPDDYVSYLKGRFFWNKRTAESLKIALAYFNQTIEEDTSYARAYSGIADTYALPGDWQYAVMTPKEAFPSSGAALAFLNNSPRCGAFTRRRRKRLPASLRWARS